MDPNANRIEQLQIARQIVDDAENHTYGAVRLAELVIALDEWMQSGGFLPRPWDNTPQECDCDERSWHGDEHDTACPLAGGKRK